MSFLNIKDKRKREETIEEYLALMDRLKRRNIEEKVGKKYYQQYLEEKYEPVVNSNKEMAEKIADELKPIKKELADLNSLITKPKLVAKRRMKRQIEPDNAESNDEEEEEDWKVPYGFGPLSAKFLDIYSDDRSRKAKLDTIFGLRKEGEVWKIGDKRVTIGPDDSMLVGDVTFSATPGFWSLVTERYPRNYTSKDLSLYKELLHETNALYQEYDPSTNRPRASSSHKWKMILTRIWQQFKETGVVTMDEFDDESGYDADTSRTNGEGMKMYLHKDGLSYDLKKTRDGAMHISPHPNLTDVYGDGLYLRRAGSGLIYNGEGLLLGPESPFKNIPILGLFL